MKLGRQTVNLLEEMMVVVIPGLKAGADIIRPRTDELAQEGDLPRRVLERQLPARTVM